MTKISIASDYAQLFSKNFRAYFGYEETDKNGNWCFVAEFNGERIIIPSTKLKLDYDFSAEEGLLKGIAIIMNRYKIANQ